MNKKLTEILKTALNNPLIIRDLCYTDEAITLWKRDEIVHRVDGVECVYHCRSCGTKRHYKDSQELKDKEYERRRGESK